MNYIISPKRQRNIFANISIKTNDISQTVKFFKELSNFSKAFSILCMELFYLICSTSDKIQDIINSFKETSTTLRFYQISCFPLSHSLLRRHRRPKAVNTGRSDQNRVVKEQNIKILLHLSTYQEPYISIVICSRRNFIHSHYN